MCGKVACYLNGILPKWHVEEMMCCQSGKLPKRPSTIFVFFLFFFTKDELNNLFDCQLILENVSFIEMIEPKLKIWDSNNMIMLKFSINIIIRHADWLNEWGMLRAHPHFLLGCARLRVHATLSHSLSFSFSLSLSPSFSLSPSLFLSLWLARERERGRERKRKRER